TDGVIPNPPAEFSALAMLKSIPLLATISWRCSPTILRPGAAKISPIKRILIRGPSTLSRLFRIRYGCDAPPQLSHLCLGRNLRARRAIQCRARIAIVLSRFRHPQDQDLRRHYPHSPRRQRSAVAASPRLSPDARRVAQDRPAPCSKIH